jgi:hypothetical protein
MHFSHPFRYRDLHFKLMINIATKRYWQSCLAAIMLIGMLMLSTTREASAHTNPNPGVFPPKSHPYGLTYGEWNARWWQWSFSVPSSKNPALTTNGAVDCSVGQSGKVWFLAGHFLTGGSFTRNCTIPHGKALLIPLINSWQDNVCNNPPLTVKELRVGAASGVFPPTELHASIDGHSLTDLESYRAISPVFSYTLPSSKDNLIYTGFGVKLPGPCWPSLTVKPAVADGFYIMLHPLTAGKHTIKFGGTGPGGFSLDMTYNITVKGCDIHPHSTIKNRK